MQVIAGEGIGGAKQKGDAKSSVELVGHRQPIGFGREAGHRIPESINFLVLVPLRVRLPFTSDWMSGIELFHHLKTHKYKVPVIFITAHAPGLLAEG